MTDLELDLIARRAGLAKALQEFRADVAAAASEAERLQGLLKDKLTPGDEPWPAMTAPAPTITAADASRT